MSDISRTLLLDSVPPFVSFCAFVEVLRAVALLVPEELIDDEPLMFIDNPMSFSIEELFGEAYDEHRRPYRMSPASALGLDCLYSRLAEAATGQSRTTRTRFLDAVTKMLDFIFYDLYGAKNHHDAVLILHYAILCVQPKLGHEAAYYIDRIFEQTIELYAEQNHGIENL